MKQLLYISFLQLIYIFNAGIFTGPIVLLVGFGYFKCNIMYEYLLKRMSPDQGNMCLNCHNNKNNNTSMSLCTDTLSFINNKYIYSLSVVALFQKPNNINNVCQAPESSFCHCHSKTQRILLSQIIGNTVLSSKKLSVLHEQFLILTFLALF